MQLPPDLSTQDLTVEQWARHIANERRGDISIINQWWRKFGPDDHSIVYARYLDEEDLLRKMRLMTRGSGHKHLCFRITDAIVVEHVDFIGFGEKQHYSYFVDINPKNVALMLKYSN